MATTQKHHHIARLLGKIQKGDHTAAKNLESLGRKFPNDPDVMNALGCLALEQGHAQKALDTFDRARDLGYANPVQYRNRMIAHAMLGDLHAFDTLWTTLEGPLETNESRIAVLRSCLRAAQTKSHADLVQRCLLLWREWEPDDLNLALSAIGVALHRKKNTEALELLTSLPPIPEHDVDTLVQAAGHAQRLGQTHAALAYFHAACEAGPTLPDQLRFLIALGNDLGQYAAALNLLKTLLQSHPALATAMLYEQLDIGQQSNQWAKVEQLVPQYLSAVRRGAIRPKGLFRHLSLPGLTDADHLMLATAYLDGQPVAQAPLPLEAFTRAPRAGRRLRIGVLSADFRQHPVAQLVVEVFERLNRQRFELVGYDLAEDKPSLLRTRILASLDQHVQARELSDAKLVNRIRDDAIDILVDLQGDTTDTRVWLLRQRLAPVQVGWLGFPGGLGAGLNDYILADQNVIPASSFDDFAEQPVWLPTTYIPNDPERQPQPCPPRISQDLPENAVVFCCFNGQYKITREIFHAWCRILQQVDNSVLWLRAENSGVMEHYRKVANDYAIATERLIFAPRTQTQVEHLTRLQCADIALDTRPYNAHTTTIDALWARIPVITLPGKSFTSRVASSILRVAGLPHLVADSIDDYVAKAVALANSREQRQALRTYLDNLRQTSPLYDTQAFVNGLEAAFEAMYECYEAQRTPAPITDLSPYLNRSGRSNEVPAERGNVIQAECAHAVPAEPAGTVPERSTALLLEHAEAHLHKDQAHEALALYKVVLARDPGQADALHGTGLAHALLGHYETALKWLDKALAARPDDTVWQAHRDKAQEKLALDHAAFLKRQLEQAHTFHARGQWPEASALYDEILARSPRHPAALHFKGLLEVQQGDARGLERMRESLRLRPGNEAFLKNYRKAETLVQSYNNSPTA